MIVTPMSWTVDRLIVTYSRIMLWLPMTTRVGSPRYFRSWGAPPMEANWAIRLSSPMSVWVSMTTWGPMIVFFPIWTSGPMMLYGPTSTPSASVASGEMIAVGWIFITFSFSFFLQGRNPALKGGKGLAHLREFREAGLHLQPLPMGHVGRAGDDLSRRDVLVNPGPGGRHDAVPDPDVADDPRLAADDDPLPQLRAARDADLGDDDGILPDHHVVGDLDEVVDLHPPLDPGPAEGAAVDGRICADLHVVVDLDVADLRDLPVFLSGKGETEAVAADDDAGMENNPPADPAPPVDGDAGIEDGGLADGGIPADEDPRVEHGLFLDARPAADVDAGIDHGLR